MSVSLNACLPVLQQPPAQVAQVRVVEACAVKRLSQCGFPVHAHHRHLRCGCAPGHSHYAARPVPRRAAHSDPAPGGRWLPARPLSVLYNQLGCQLDQLAYRLFFPF